MTLTLTNGPLAPGAPASTNYSLDGPQHKLLFSPFPRRMRAVFGGETVFDTDRGMLLHESNILPVLYVPVEDVRFDLLSKTDRSSHCPFKGDASYWSIAVGDRVSENSVWGYESPDEDAPWLVGYVAFYWDEMDHWFDEDEEVFGHIRDTYHRIDVRPTSRPVTVKIAGTTVAETTSAKILSETGFPNRYYIPASAISTELFEQSSTTTHCPYKGDTEYWSFTSDLQIDDVAWSYPTPFDEARRIAGHWCFLGDKVTIEVG